MRLAILSPRIKNMYRQETITPYSTGDKAAQVEQMFDNIAPTYDVLNHRLSWNIDRYWRKKALRRLLPYHPRDIVVLNMDQPFLLDHLVGSLNFLQLLLLVLLI